jgi:hypothetical protein
VQLFSNTRDLAVWNFDKHFFFETTTKMLSLNGRVANKIFLANTYCVTFYVPEPNLKIYLPSALWVLATTE